VLEALTENLQTIFKDAIVGKLLLTSANNVESLFPLPDCPRRGVITVTYGAIVPE